MSGRPSRTAIVAAIVIKDLREFSRDKLWLVLTPLGMLTMVVAFWILPSEVDETVSVGLYPPGKAEPLRALLNPEDGDAVGVEVVPFDERERLIAAVAGERNDGEEPELSVGIAFSENFDETLLAGRPVTATLYVDGTVPAQLTRALTGEVREIAYALEGLAQGLDPKEALPVDLGDDAVVVLGEDRSGAQVPLREKLRPMLALLILMVGAIGLAGLVAGEIEQRTVTALRVTPMRTGDLLAAKVVTGTVLGASQAVIFVFATWSFGDHPVLVSLLMFQGAVMMSGVGMLAGAAGKDFMSTMFFSVVMITPLMIPAFTLLFPGTAALWVRMVPTYGLVRALVDVVGYGHGWVEAWPHIVTATLWIAVMLAVALVVLRRRLEAP